MGDYTNCVDLIKALLLFVGSPLAVVYGFYFWAKRAENLAKIAKEMKTCGVSDEVTESVVNSGANNQT